MTGPPLDSSAQFSTCFDYTQLLPLTVLSVCPSVYVYYLCILSISNREGALHSGVIHGPSLDFDVKTHQSVNLVSPLWTVFHHGFVRNKQLRLSNVNVFLESTLCDDVHASSDGQCL